MINVIQYMNDKGLKPTEFLLSIGSDYKNLGKIKAGVMRFKLYQIDSCIRKYKINPGYFFLKSAPMFTPPGKT